MGDQTICTFNQLTGFQDDAQSGRLSKLLIVVALGEGMTF
jgi:hypothetical protein